MSSDAATQTARDTAPRCLFCNVGCPVRVQRSGPDHVIPDYVPHAGYVGLCGRGSVMVEWLDHPGRLLEVQCPGRGGERLAVEQAAARIGEALRGAASAAVIVDALCDTDTVAAAGRLAAGCGARWSVLAPAGDAGLVHALDSSGAAFVGPEDLAGADALLVIGNVFATHPVVSHWIFRARQAHARLPLLVVADGPTPTATFASAVYSPAAKVGEAARAVAAVRTGAADGLGPDAAVLASWKAHLKAAKKPAIVVGAELGYADARALGAEVARLAADLGAAVCPLTACGNAWGALRASSAGGGTCPIRSLAQPADVLLVVGADLESSVGSRAASAALDSAKDIFYVGPMPNRTSRRASLVVPAAFPFEAPGRALLGPGRPVTFGPLMPPPAGVPTARAVLELAGAEAGAEADVSRPCHAPDVPASAAVADSEGIVVALAADPFHFGDGSLTRLAAWPQTVRPRPVLVLAPADAETAGVVDGQRAVIEGPGGSAEVEVATSPAQREGYGRASAAFGEVRDVFGWSHEGTWPGEPAR
ncbi:MAG: hypothetical protein IMZ66_10140, partial [Planctomycetes bacterium]|nr:hypothetical protein [Planctomycetota bacterium]